MSPFNKGPVILGPHVPQFRGTIAQFQLQLKNYFRNLPKRKVEGGGSKRFRPFLRGIVGTASIIISHLKNENLWKALMSRENWKQLFGMKRLWNAFVFISKKKSWENEGMHLLRRGKLLPHRPNSDTWREAPTMQWANRRLPRVRSKFHSTPTEPPLIQRTPVLEQLRTLGNIG